MKELLIKKLDGIGLLSKQVSDLGNVTTGCYALNKIISGDYNGGYPIGSITEIYGESSTAKTVFLTHAFVGAQKQGFYTVMIDNEQAYSPVFAQTLGVDPDRLIYLAPDTLEECFEAIENSIKAIREHDTETPILIGYDSIGVSPSKKEMDGGVASDPNMGGALRAKVAGICLRRINPLLRKHKAGLIIINQIRSKVGVMFGDPRTKAGGGKSLLYYCGTSLETVSNKSDVLYDEHKNPLGIKGTLKAVKNKITIPYQECEFELLYDRGLTRDYGLAQFALKKGLVTQPSKGWYSLDGSAKGRAKDISKVLGDKIAVGEIQ